MFLIVLRAPEGGFPDVQKNGLNGYRIIGLVIPKDGISTNFLDN